MVEQDVGGSDERDRPAEPALDLADQPVGELPIGPGVGRVGGGDDLAVAADLRGRRAEPGAPDRFGGAERLTDNGLLLERQLVEVAQRPADGKGGVVDGRLGRVRAHRGARQRGDGERRGDGRDRGSVHAASDARTSPAAPEYPVLIPGAASYAGCGASASSASRIAPMASCSLAAGTGREK